MSTSAAVVVAAATTATAAAEAAAVASRGDNADLEEVMARIFDLHTRELGFVVRPARDDDHAALTDAADCIFGVPRHVLRWDRRTGARWHQHWTTHVVRLRGNAYACADPTIVTSAPLCGAHK